MYARRSETESMRYAHRYAPASLIVLLVLLLSGCQPVQPPAVEAAAPEAAAEIPNVVITATDSSFNIPAEIPAGLVSLTLKNEGDANHHAIIGRMFDDVTLEQVGEMLAKGDESEVFGDLDMFMPDTIPGGATNVLLDMPPGRWAVFSFSMGEDMVPDFAKGLLAEFTVTDSVQPATAAPDTDLTVTLSDDDFDMPSELTAGSHTIQVTNAGSADNAFVFFVQLGGDTTLDDILSEFDALFTTGTMPEEMSEFWGVGGLMTNTVSDTYWTTIDLEPGNYVAISNIGSTGFPYSGMAKYFTVK